MMDGIQAELTRSPEDVLRMAPPLTPEEQAKYKVAHDEFLREIGRAVVEALYAAGYELLAMDDDG